MAEMTRERFDELVEYVTREHGQMGVETRFRYEGEEVVIREHFFGGITDPDYYGIAGIAALIAQAYWLTRSPGLRSTG